MDLPAQIEHLKDDLRAAGIGDADLAEVEQLARRDPSEVSIAVVGPHNVGKTTLIAALTGDDRAREGIAPTIKTMTSERYRLSHGGVTFDIWDTPGLGTERFEHDAETRERVTKADALVVTVSSELLSDRARDDLRRLLILGRKVGATVFVVTKADREPGDRVAIENELAGDLHPVPREQARPVWVAARDFLNSDGRDDPLARDSGVPELLDAVRSLATGEASEHLRYTAAVRMVRLIDEALPQLVKDDQVELEAALRLQQRLHVILRDGARSIERSIEARVNQLTLLAARSAARVTDAYDEDGDVTDAVETALRAAVADFDTSADELSQALGEEVRRLLEEMAVACERLEAGQLAAALRDVEVGVMPGPAGGDHTAPAVGRAWKRPEYVNDVKGVLDNVMTVGTALSQAGGGSFDGLDPVSAIATGVADIVLSVKEHRARERRAQEVGSAKTTIRLEFGRRAETTADVWRSELGVVRTTTLEPAAESTRETERRLGRQLGSAESRAARLRAARAELEAAIPAKAWRPAATQPEIAAVSTAPA